MFLALVIRRRPGGALWRGSGGDANMAVISGARVGRVSRGRSEVGSRRKK
jgi:hypothetical protein